MQKTFALLLLTSQAYALPLQNLPFTSQEVTRFQIRLRYKGLFWVKGVELETKIAALDPSSGQINFYSKAHSTDTIARVKNVSLKASSSWDFKTGGTVRFELHNIENQWVTDDLEVFNYQSMHGLTRYLESESSLVKNATNLEYPINNPIQDIVSMLYFIRASELPQSANEPPFTFQFAYKGVIWNSTLTYVSTGEVPNSSEDQKNRTKILANKYHWRVVGPNNAINDTTTIWIGTDKAKTIERIESKIPDKGPIEVTPADPTSSK